MNVQTPVYLGESAQLGGGIAAGDGFHEAVYRLTLRKYRGEVTPAMLADGTAPEPYEVLDLDSIVSLNLLMTAGATAFWNGLVTSGLGTPFNSTNCQLVVGDSNTAASAGQTDMQAAAGSTQNTGDVSAATNATPIVLTVPGWNTQPLVGQVVVVAGVLGNTAANGTFEVSAVNGTTLTLLNSAGNGAFATSAGSTIKIINKYRQLVNGAPSVTTNSCAFTAVFGTANANHVWAEWGITTGGAATNKQAVPPPTLLNRAVTALGTKTSAGTWTLTATGTLS